MYNTILFVWVHRKCFGVAEFDTVEVRGFYCPDHEEGVAFGR